MVLLLACLFINYINTWTGLVRGVLLSAGTDRCLSLYSGLTQCQGHSPTSLSVHIFLAKYWLNLFRNYYWTIKAFAFYCTVSREKLMKNMETSLYCETTGHRVCHFNLKPIKSHYVQYIQCGCWSLRSTIRGLPLDGMGRTWSASSNTGGCFATLSLLGGCAGPGRK